MGETVGALFSAPAALFSSFLPRAAASLCFPRERAEKRGRGRDGGFAERLFAPRFDQRFSDRAHALILVLGELEKALDEIEKKTTDPE